MGNKRATAKRWLFLCAENRLNFFSFTAFLCVFLNVVYEKTVVRTLLIIFLSLFQLQGVLAQPEIPLERDSVIPLLELKDDELRDILKAELCANKKWKKLIETKRLSVGLVDLSNLDDIKYAGLNDNFMMYAASLPKIAILLASMDAMENGELEGTPEVMEDLNLMIRRSNNGASTRMIDRLGYEKIEEVLRGSRYMFYDENVGGGLWVGKRYAAGGRRYPEPIKGLSHAATTWQVCNFYYLLVMGELVSPKRSEKMLEIMANPALHHKFVNTLDQIAPKAQIYRKSGSWRNFHSDSALVWGPERRYIIVVLLDDSYGEQIIRKIVKPLERVIKRRNDM